MSQAATRFRDVTLNFDDLTLEGPLPPMKLSRPLLLSFLSANSLSPLEYDMRENYA